MRKDLGWRPVKDGGRVECPRRGEEEVDLVRCLECNWLLDLDRSGRPALRCAVTSQTLTTSDSYLRPRHID